MALNYKLYHKCGFLQAFDVDTGVNSELRYFLTSPSNSFSIDSREGDVTVVESLGLDGGETIRMRAEARDSRGAPKGKFATLDLVVRKKEFSRARQKLRVILWFL